MNSNKSRIVDQHSFLAQQLCKMQDEMDGLNTASPEPDNVVPIGQNNLCPEVPVPSEEFDAVLVTGSFEFRPSTQIKTRLTLPAIDKAMVELENVLSKLGVTVDYDRIRAVALNNSNTQIASLSA